MEPMTTAQAVASGTASLVLFTATVLAGYALAAPASPARSLAPAGHSLHKAHDRNPTRHESRRPRRDRA